MAVPTKEDRYRQLIESYWNPDLPHSFCSLDHQLVNCEKRMQKEKVEAIEAISSVISDWTKLKPIIDQKWALLKEAVEEVRGIEKTVEEARLIKLEAHGINSPSFVGDYDIFCSRLNRQTKEINLVYQKTLYPFLQLLQNAKTNSTFFWNGWKACDYWNFYFFGDAKEEIGKVFPNAPFKNVVG